MNYYYNKLTKKKISQDEYDKLDEKDKKQCRPWKEKSPKNDFSWYNVSDTISKAVGNIPFNRFPGVRETIQFASGTAEGSPAPIVSSNATPGVFAIDYIPSYGDSSNANSAMNLCARGMYSWVRHQNSGKTNYEAPDLMLYVMAMDQVYTAFFEAERIYHLAMTYTFENRYIPRAIASVINVDLAQVQANLANYRAKLNLLAAKISSLCVPAKYNIYRRHALLVQYVFMDSTSLRGQLYIFHPENFLKFSSTTEATGGSLSSFVHSVDDTSNLRTTDTITKDLSDMIDAILQDEDMNIMSGDILKAYGRENLFGLDFVDENATLKIAMVEDILQQIENSHTIPKNTSNAVPFTYKITQTSSDATDNYLVTSKIQTYDVAARPLDLYFNSHKDTPTYQNVIEWSRCTCSGETYGTEIILGYKIACYAYDPANGTQSLQTVSFTSDLRCIFLGSNSAAAQTSVKSTLNTLSLISQFDWAPIVYVFFVAGTTASSEVTYINKVADLKVYTIIHPEEIQALHDAAVMGAINGLTMSAN